MVVREGISELKSASEIGLTPDTCIAYTAD